MCKGKAIVGCVSILVLICMVLIAQPVWGVVMPDMKDGKIEKSGKENLLELKDVPQKALYKEGEIIVKFKESAANKLGAAAAEKPSLSASLDTLNNKYKVDKIEPVVKNFKAKRARIANIQKKDKSVLTAADKHLLRRLNRAPKGAKVPDLGRIYKITLGEGQSASKAAAEYRKNADVEYAELNYIVQAYATPNDPHYGQQWALRNIGQSYPIWSGGTDSGTSDCDIDANEAWDIQTGSSDVVVAVIDSGVDYNHADIQNNMWTDANGYHGYDFVNNDNYPMDDAWHGTHVAGIIAANGNNNDDIAGVCWDASIMAVKFLNANGYGTTEDAIRAIEYATDNGADVLNNSWGVSSPMPSCPPIEEAIDYAYDSGCIVVFAAGNNGWNTYWNVNDYSPQNYFKTISVGATDSDDKKTYYSCYGESLKLAAPGDYILSLRAVGTGDWDSFYPYRDPNATMCIHSGTSMACPHVSGLAALCLAEDPNLTNISVQILMQCYADDIENPNDPNDDLYFGYGRINANNTLSNIPNGQVKVHNITQDTCYETIQSALSDASSGDEIVVYPGTYEGSINVGNSIKLRSVDPNDWRCVEQTIIDTSNSGGAVNIWGNAVVEGFTITRDGESGYGVTFVSTGNCTVSHCIIKDATCGILTSGESLTVKNCKIYNTGDGIWIDDAGTIIVKNCWIYNNGTGVNLAYDEFGGNLTVTNCTLAGNTSSGITNPNGYGSDQLSISNCILWDNGDDLDNCNATYSCIQDGDSGTGNISSDPCFVDADTNDFHIKPNSPCINAGDPNGNYGSQVDIDSELRVMRQRVDIGADEFPRVHNVIQDIWYQWIVDAVCCADSNDEIVVYPDTYYDSRYLSVFYDIKLRGADPNKWDVVEGTVIASNYDGTVYLWDGVIEGLTITNSYGARGSGVRYLSYGGPYEAIVSKCKIRNCSIGVYTYGLTPLVIKNCKIYNNNDGIWIDDSGETVVENCWIYNNSGAGINLDYDEFGGNLTVTNSTLAGNISSGITNPNGYGSDQLSISNCILWDNGDDLDYCNATYSCISDCNDVGDPNETHNICADPCFVNADANNFHLKSNSPCIDAGDPNGNYDGEVDIDNEVRVFNGQVDIGADEVDPNLVGWWTFDEGSGTTASDSAGEHTGTLVGNASWASGKVGAGALNLDGSGDYVQVANSTDLNITGDVTIAAWVYLREGGDGSDGSCQGIVTKTVNNGAYNNPYDFRTGATAIPQLAFVRADSNGHEYAYSSQSLSLNTWHHVAVVVNNNGASFYVNGDLTDKSFDNINRPATGNTNPLRIGARADGLYLDGKIDDVRLYNRILSAAEIQALYQGGL